MLLYVSVAKYVEKTHRVERTSDKSTRPWLVEYVNSGHPTRLIRLTQLTRTAAFRTAAVKQQKTTAAILIRTGLKESGAIQRMSIHVGNRVMSQSVVSPLYFLALFTFILYSLSNGSLQPGVTRPSFTPNTAVLPLMYYLFHVYIGLRWQPLFGSPFGLVTGYHHHVRVTVKVSQATLEHAYTQIKQKC